MTSIASDNVSAMPRGRKRRDAQAKNEGKRFICDNDGCGRSFTRAEHLQRHLLNHSTGEYTCDRCRAHFKRRDLLGKIPFFWSFMHDEQILHRAVVPTLEPTARASILSCQPSQEWMNIYTLSFPPSPLSNFTFIFRLFLEESELHQRGIKPKYRVKFIGTFPVHPHCTPKTDAYWRLSRHASCYL